MSLLSLSIPVHSPKPPPLPKSLRLRRPDPHPSLLGFCSDCGSWFHPRGAGLGCSPAKTPYRIGAREDQSRAVTSASGGRQWGAHRDSSWGAAPGTRPGWGERRSQLGTAGPDWAGFSTPKLIGLNGTFWSSGSLSEQPWWIGGSGRLLRTQFGHPHFHPHQVRALISLGAQTNQSSSRSASLLLPLPSH